MVKDSNFFINLKVGARDLPDRTSCLCLGGSNPYFEIFRGTETIPTQYVKIYDSDPINGRTTVSFPPLGMKL